MSLTVTAHVVHELAGNVPATKSGSFLKSRISSSFHIHAILVSQQIDFLPWRCGSSNLDINTFSSFSPQFLAFKSCKLKFTVCQVGLKMLKGSHS